MKADIMREFKIIMFTLLLTLFCFVSRSQQKTLSPVAIGQQVPNIRLDTIIDFSKPSATLSDFRGKLLILDFWSTWCSGCIKAMPELEKLQLEFAGKLQILPVSFTSTQKQVKDFFKKMKSNGRPINMPSAIFPTLKNDMLSLFPIYGGFPMEVWIDSEGKLLAITDSYYITRENIEKAINHLPLKLPLSSAYAKSVSNDTIPIQKTELLSNAKFYSRLTGYVDSVPQNKQRRLNKETGNERLGISIMNASVVDMFKASVYGTLIGHNDLISVDLPDSQSLFYPAIDTNFYKNLKQNSFCYELVLPSKVPVKDALKLMNTELGIYFGIETKIEKRPVDCWILKQIQPTFNLSTVESKEDFGADKAIDHFWQKNTPVSHLISWISGYSKTMVFDETGYNKNIDLDIYFKKEKTIKAYNEALRKSNLILEKAVRDIDKLVLKRKLPT